MKHLTAAAKYFKNAPPSPGLCHPSSDFFTTEFHGITLNCDSKVEQLFHKLYFPCFSVSFSGHNMSSSFCSLSFALCPLSSVFRLPHSDFRFLSSAFCPLPSDICPLAFGLYAMRFALCPVLLFFRLPHSQFRILVRQHHPPIKQQISTDQVPGML